VCTSSFGVDGGDLILPSFVPAFQPHAYGAPLVCSTCGHFTRRGAEDRLGSCPSRRAGSVRGRRAGRMAKIAERNAAVALEYSGAANLACLVSDEARGRQTRAGALPGALAPCTAQACKSASSATLGATHRGRWQPRFCGYLSSLPSRARTSPLRPRQPRHPIVIVPQLLPPLPPCQSWSAHF